MTVYITVISVRHRRTLNLAVSHKEINGINWFLMCPSNIFLRNGSGFSDFWHNGRQFKYWKTDSRFFQENSFLPKFGQKGPRMAPQNRVLDFFLKNFVLLVLLENNVKWKLILFLIFHEHIWQIFGSQVIGENAASQSVCRIL